MSQTFRNFTLIFFNLEETPLHFPLMSSSSKSPGLPLVLPQCSPSAKTPNSSLHSQMSVGYLFWSHRSNSHRTVAGERNTYFEYKEKKKKIKEEKKLMGIIVKEHEWTQAMTGYRLQRGGRWGGRWGTLKIRRSSCLLWHSLEVQAVMVGLFQSLSFWKTLTGRGFQCCWAMLLKLIQLPAFQWGGIWTNKRLLLQLHPERKQFLTSWCIQELNQHMVYV